jgi:broad specificity phosphatase PhoE
MGPPVILIRHGESEFNVVFSRTRVDPGIEDPGLTAHGRHQAREAAAALSGHGVRRLISSPYTRALETAEIIATELGLPVEIEPLVRERGHFACDVGSPASRLGEIWPHRDFDHLDEVWWQEGETEAAVSRRCERFLERIVDHADWPHLGVVAHWGFIRTLSGLELGNCELVRYDPFAERGRVSRAGGDESRPG